MAGLTERGGGEAYVVEIWSGRSAVDGADYDRLSSTMIFSREVVDMYVWGDWAVRQNEGMESLLWVDVDMRGGGGTLYKLHFRLSEARSCAMVWASVLLHTRHSLDVSQSFRSASYRLVGDDQVERDECWNRRGSWTFMSYGDWLSLLIGCKGTEGVHTVQGRVFGWSGESVGGMNDTTGDYWVRYDYGYSSSCGTGELWSLGYIHWTRRTGLGGLGVEYWWWEMDGDELVQQVVMDMTIDEEVWEAGNGGSFNEFTLYKNEALYTRIATYSDQTRPNLTFVSTSWRHPWDRTLGITLIRMSAMANATPIVTTVTKNANNEKAPDAASRVNIQDFCEEHYEDILPIIMEKAWRDKADNSPTRFHPGISRTRGRKKRDDKNVFNRLSHRRKSMHERLSDTYSPSATKSGPNGTNSRDPSHSRGHSLNQEHPRIKDRFRGIEESYSDTYSRGTRTRYRDRSCDKDRFHSGLRGSGLMNYLQKKGLKAAFVAYFMQQKKYVKDPVEIHNIKQRDGETIEDFMERFKVETGRMKGAPECMRISGFMHGVNNPELTKRLNEHVPKIMEEMMTVTTAFIQGEAAAASKKKGHLP
ncbi:hypothetical protein Tco_1429759 [Tanacetum coccineum]